MALPQMQVFQKYFEMTMIEVLNNQVNAFNEATGGCLILKAGNNHGDYVESSYMQAMPNFLFHRDPRATGAVADQTMQQDIDRSVKVARRAGPIVWDVTQFKWIMRDPREAALAIGENFAAQRFQMYFNLAIGVLVSAMSNGSANIDTDVSGAGTPTMTLGHMNTAVSKFGDASQRLTTWFMHSKPAFDLYGASIANQDNLFKFGNVIVKTDPFGRKMVISDSPAFVNPTPTPDEYYNLCLQPGSIVFEENDDYTSMHQEVLGQENLGHRWQAEWSFNAKVKNYKWDSTNGGAAPTDAALQTSTNWDLVSSQTHKDLPGVRLITQ